MTPVLLREEICLDLWETRVQDFGVHRLQANSVAHRLSPGGVCRTAIPGQQALFAHLSSQQERGGLAKWAHTDKHRGIGAEATTQGRQQQQGPEGLGDCTGKETGGMRGATGATLEVGKWKEVLHKVQHGTYITEEHSDSAQGAQDTPRPDDRPYGLDKT